MEQHRPAPRLMLVTPLLDEVAGFARNIPAVLGAADIAALVLRLGPTDDATLVDRAKTVAPVVQASGTALLLHGLPDLVAPAGADGAHLTGIGALQAAIGGLQPQHIAGTGGVKTRHDAMLAGEAGADYVMFGEPDTTGRRPSFDAVVERVTWWAGLFEIPCVGFAASLDEVKPLVAAGADFVAVGDCIFADERGDAAAVADAVRRLAVAETVA